MDKSLSKKNTTFKKVKCNSLMNKTFINEVRTIVINNMSDEKFGVQELASSIKLSSSQTLRKVKAATGKSVNQYIRELRLEKAATLLKETDHTAAEIAYQVGFNSASYFNKTFSKYYGIAPGEYKTRNINLTDLASKRQNSILNSFFSNKRFVFAITIILILFLGTLLINPFLKAKNPEGNSIAVLPFKDLSQEDNKWFCDGIADNILHQFAQIDSLKVISFTSSSTYRDSDKSISQMAKELGVTHILEGSVTLHDGKIKIITQLINASDEHVWSHEYNDDFENIFDIQNNVAKEVMQQMEVALNKNEVKRLNEYPTKNMEAYNLFLKGRLIDNSREKEDLLKNIELNKEAIALDSNFAEAYAEVAHSYWQLSRYFGYRGYNAEEGIDLAHKYADSALRINTNTYRALGVKAALSAYLDWDKTDDYYKKALAINPNDALTHIQYALYFQFRPNPDIKNYLKHLTISKQLDPISSIQAINYLNALIFNNKIKEAEKFLSENEFQIDDSHIRQFEYKLIAFKNKDWTKVIPYLKAKSENDPDNDLYYQELAYTSNAILNDDNAAVAYMEKAYKIDSLDFFNVVPYVNMLIEDRKYEKAYSLMTSENFKSILNKQFQLKILWYYHYLKGESKKTLEISKEAYFTNDYELQVLTYAQLGNRKKVDSMNKKYPYGTGVLIKWRANKAILHAVLKDEDSMYYYLENAQYDDVLVLQINSRREFDPYRDDERYKAFLRMNYLPVLVD